MSTETLQTTTKMLEPSSWLLLKMIEQAEAAFDAQRRQVLNERFERAVAINAQNHPTRIALANGCHPKPRNRRAGAKS